MNINGLKDLLLKGNKPQAVKIANQLGFKQENRYLRKEIEIVTQIQEFLPTLKIPFEFQKTVGTYRVDLYLPTKRLAIEIDENGHNNRDPVCETKRRIY